MGYTHYYYQNKSFTQKQWEKICLDTLKVVIHCDKKKIVLAYEYDSPVDPLPSIFGGFNHKPKCPEVSNDIIRFNGWKDEGHETFIIERKCPKAQPWIQSKQYFGFCKTAYKPYDIAVGLVLLVVASHAPKTIEVSSDGDWDGDWAEIRKAYKEIFGKEAVCPFKVEEPA
jgi:hypothetical protein